ncbi:MAG: DUF1579 domain-containing protein [Chthoniobacterales bacterium]|nr:DUF1579 domain-containing protein [Chthoniobacterales bacterium]
MKNPLIYLLAAVCAATLTATSLFAQTTASSPASSPATAGAAAQPGAPDMQQMMAMMMEMGKTGENHKVLASMAGDWTYTLKMWMDPKAPPQESKGTSTRKAIMDGRYFIAEHTGKFQMPGPDGKMKDMDFKGMAIEGYDNAKKKFVSSWIDNMSTMIMNAEGTYDAASKTFNYNAQCQMMPGKTTNIREVIKIVDNDHHTFEWYDDMHGAEAKTMEISYTRKK